MSRMNLSGYAGRVYRVAQKIKPLSRIIIISY